MRTAPHSSVWTDTKIVFSADAVHELQVMTSAITEILENTYSAFKDEDLDIAKKVEPLEQIVDKLKAKMRANHIVRLQNDECTIETGFIYSDLITSFERVADHCSNIGVCLLSVANDSFDTHEYLQHVKADGENNFKENYALYKEKYSI